MQKTDYISEKVSGTLRVIVMLCGLRRATHRSPWRPLVQWAPTWNTKVETGPTSITVTCALSGDDALFSIEVADLSSTELPLSCPGVGSQNSILQRRVALKNHQELQSIPGQQYLLEYFLKLLYNPPWSPLMGQSRTCLPTQPSSASLGTTLCLHPEKIYHESRVAAPSVHHRSKELPYCRRTCEWKSSLRSSHHPGFSVLDGGGGWVCAKMARELKWNSQISPPTSRSLIKAPVLFSLAICLLHVSTIVKLCVICCDSFIILESTDVALRSLQIQQRPNRFLLL